MSFSRNPHIHMKCWMHRTVLLFSLDSLVWLNLDEKLPTSEQRFWEVTDKPAHFSDKCSAYHCNGEVTLGNRHTFISKSLIRFNIVFSSSSAPSIDNAGLLDEKLQLEPWPFFCSGSSYQTRGSTRLSTHVLLGPLYIPCHFFKKEHLVDGTVTLPCRWTPCCVSWFMSLPWGVRGVANWAKFKHSLRVPELSLQSDSGLTCKLN